MPKIDVCFLGIVRKSDRVFCEKPNKDIIVGGGGIFTDKSDFQFERILLRYITIS